MVRRRAPQIALSVVAVMALCGSRSNCDTRTPTLVCAPVSITLDPGQCVTLNNPCDTQWRSQDGFKLCDEPAGLSVSTVRVRGVITRQICAAATIAPLANQPVGFLYSQTADFGEGNITVTIGQPLSIAASASPSTVPMGTGTQLNVAVTGGVAPYTFTWAPGNIVSNPTIQNPMAFPINTTVFTVTVRDAAMNVQTDTVTVTVSSALMVTASPDTINIGQLTQLTATLQGAVPPVTYLWTPDNGTLTTTTLPNPIAFPSQTTTYTVTVMDGSAASPYTGSVTVTVNMNGSATATPPIVVPGGTSQLDSGANGGLPPYTYSWADPTGTLSATNIANPVASPSATTTYTVTITDMVGQQITRSVTVNVNGATLAACFTSSPTNPTAPTLVTIDMSCSSGSVTQFTLWLNYAPGAPPSYVGTQPVYQTFSEAPVTYNVRVQVEDAGGNTAFIEGPIVVQ